MSEMQRERDLVLNPNEFAYVLDKTKGLISCVVGPYKMSLSTSDSLVVFNERNKRFEESTLSDAITTFISAPENWYVTLKNPAKDDRHPTPGTANPLPDLQIGKKVNIRGNVSFALYPGQMAKAIQGHRLHSNQYLLARVYDADALEKIKVDGDGENTSDEYRNKYTTGQLLVIKGTDVPFYIPPTGIEVLPADGRNTYVRDAVTLERLEYCILKDEQGNKKYVHGAAVVFPEPDEEFVKNTDGGYKFKAIELSDISGIYVKVIADYEENGRQYKTGEELFITGKDQMIYYPRPEHAIIKYNDKVLHHAIAIPAGEGRYVLDRMTGNIKTVKGPAMYLPDPRKEVIVKRKLTKKQCELWYPGNIDVLNYNVGYSYNVSACCDSISATNTSLMSTSSKGISTACSFAADSLSNGFLGQANAKVEDAGFSRGNTYSKPRTITIDNKYDGVVSIDIWTGYAINVISKTGDRKVIVGPQTYLLDYDETIEVLELSTGKPKTTDNLLKTVYLRVDNNKISDIINATTKDFVDVSIKVSYCVDFLPEYKDSWFSVENYVKYMTDRQRSLIKNEVKKYNIEEFYESASDIVRNVALDNAAITDISADKPRKSGRLFSENGMLVHDVEVLSVKIDNQDICNMISNYHKNVVEKSLELSSTMKEAEISKQIAIAEKERANLENECKMYALELQSNYDKEKVARADELERAKEEAQKTRKTAEKNIQELIDSIQASELARREAQDKIEISRRKKFDELEIAKEKAHTEAIKSVMESISPDLIAALTSSSNAELMKTVAESMSPYALASGESISDVTNKLLRGTSLEGLLEKVTTK